MNLSRTFTMARQSNFKKRMMLGTLLPLSLFLPVLAVTENIALNKSYQAGAFSYPNPSGAFDGNPATTSGDKTNVDGSLAVDFGSEKPLLRTVIHFSHNTPQRYKIQGSHDGTTWNDILRVYNPSFTDERILPKATYRYVKFAIYYDAGVGEEPNLLNPVSEIEIYERGGGDPAGSDPIVFPVPFDRSKWKATFVGQGAPQDMSGAISAPQQAWADPHGNFEDPDHFWLGRNGISPGNAAVIDMGEVKDFNQLWFTHNHDAWFDFKIFVSDDGIEWGNPLVTAQIVSIGAYEMAPTNFPLQHKRYFKIQSEWDSHARWSGFWNISALNTIGSSLVDTGDNENLSLKATATCNGCAGIQNILDGNQTTSVQDLDSVIIDLGKPYAIARHSVSFASSVNGFAFKVHSSTDGTNWTLQQNVTLPTVSPKAFASRTLANYTARFLKFKFPTVTGQGGSQNKYTIKEIEIYKATGREPVIPVVGLMGKNNTNRTSKNIKISKNRAFRMDGRKTNYEHIK